ncbi:hypothetical protein ACFQY5_35770 [Paeniroseomonas aquatica]|uniref:Uncharacterized protein n=1 Tax=Paeniroseomonas aquatica TaxID=373043 RepID=A0ABT8AG32_9PROT|nr:hypothetical protein [Paeniroseomonas aquatica]MDN3568722.1 hypothetical protein [Paeniroseomonas aquatica]
MSGFWKGYANVNDDVRHTYEQVFFGRQTTGNLTEAEVPGMKPEQPAPDAFAGEGSSTNAPPQHDHAAFYGSVWGNGDAPPIGPGEPPNGPDLTPGGAVQVQAPTIEAPKIEPPSQGNDMTPGD